MATTRAPRSTTPRGRAAKQAAAKQVANEQNLQNMQKEPTPAPSPADDLIQRGKEITNGSNKQPTNDANLVVPRIQHSLLVQGIKEAMASFKAAISVEVAVCCAVFAQGNAGTSTAAKKELYGIYEEAGYECKVGGEGKDYKTVNRRIGYAAQFYDSLEEDTIKNLLGDAKDLAAMQALVGHISTKYNFRSMNDVLTAAGVTPPSRQRAQAPVAPEAGAAPQGGAPAPAAPATEGQSVFQTSATATPTGVPQPSAPSAGDLGVAGAVAEAGAAREAARREFDDTSKWVKYSYDGATIIVPVDMKTASLHELGIKMVQAAAHMRGDKIDVATLNAEFKEAVAAH